MSFFIKIFFIIFFILITIFLAYVNYLNYSNKFLNSAPPIIKNSKEFLYISSGLAGIYSLYTRPSTEEWRNKYEEEKINYYRKAEEINNNLSEDVKKEQIHQEMKEFLKNNNSKNKLFNFDFNLQDFLSSLTRLELFAFISICFNSVIINALISIVFILYGDFLIRYFNLEIKYPRLAKFINYRKTINKYALYYNLFLIFFCTMSQLSACLIVF